MSAPAVPRCAAPCVGEVEEVDEVEDAVAPLDSDGPGILLPTLDLDEPDTLVKRSVEARLVAVAAIAETRYTCDVADLVLERLRRPARRARR